MRCNRLPTPAKEILEIAEKSGNRPLQHGGEEEGKRTIVDSGREAGAPHESTRIPLRLAFEVAGIEIIESNGGGAGVQCREQRQTMVLAYGLETNSRTSMEATQPVAAHPHVPVTKTTIAMNRKQRSDC